MQPHPVFEGLVVPGDEEISLALGGDPVRRSVVHEWPLSRTEDVVLADGRRLALKVQLPPSVEAPFYEVARGRVLAPARALGTLRDAAPGHEHDVGVTGPCTWSAIDWVDASSLAAISDDARYREVARRAAEGIAAIRSDEPARLPPVALDLRGVGWATAVDDVLAGLARLTAPGPDGGTPTFAAIDPRAVDPLRRWCGSDEIRELLDSDPVVVHGDLFPDEVLLPDEGHPIVIDWQRPAIGPAGLDLAGLLRRRGRDPEGDGLGAASRMLAFLELRWAVLAIRDILPGLPPALPQSWAIDAIRLILPRR